MDKDHVNLFNFLRGDAESSRKDIRQKKSFLVLLNTVESLMRDLNYLEDFIFPNRKSNPEIIKRRS